MNTPPASASALRSGRVTHDADGVRVFEITFETSTGAGAGRCHASRCVAPATHTPFLHIALVGKEHVSRVELPAAVCARHREAFASRFLTPARRATIETSLRCRGKSAPDWSRTYVDFA